MKKYTHTRRKRTPSHPNQGPYDASVRSTVSKSAQRHLDTTGGKLTGELAHGDELTQTEQTTLRLIVQTKDSGNPKQLDAPKQLLDESEGQAAHYPPTRAS